VRSGRDDVEVAGLDQPLRIRGELGERSELARQLLLPGSGADAFRQLVFCDQLGALGGVERGWVRPTDLLVLTDDPPATVGRGWVVRQLVEQCMNAITLGPDAILDLARLVCATRIHVARARTVASVRDLGDAALQPLEVLPDLLPSRHDQETDPGGDTPVQVQVGVRTVLLGAECAVWIPGDPPTVIHLEGSGAAWWSALQHGEDVPSGAGFAGFVSELQRCGALVGDAEPHR